MEVAFRVLVEAGAGELQTALGVSQIITIKMAAMHLSEHLSKLNSLSMQNAVIYV